MNKKKLQIEELKVKSFVTVVDRGEQKTTKGGIVNFQTHGYIINDISGPTPWTEVKTRVDNSENILLNPALGDSGTPTR